MATRSPLPNIRQALESAGAHYTNLIEFGILKVFIDFKVFDNIPSEGDISLAELATKTGGDESLLRRFADYLIASDVLTSPGPDRVAHTARSLSYCSAEIAAGFISHVYHFFLRPMAAWATYFEQNGLFEPRDAHTIPLGLGTGHSGLDLYGVLDAEPELAKLFNSAQERSAAIYSLQGVYDFSWVQEVLAQPDNTRPAIVDIGGSHGLALGEILENNKFVPAARCAVFDLPKTIEAARSKIDPGNSGLSAVRFVGGTMLEPLPVAIRGAVVYQFRRVLSDFVDNDIIVALTHVREACAADSRVLLIEELVKPTRGKFAIAQDISVMNFGGKRRSEAMWRELAERAGLRVSGVFEDAKSEFAVLELLAV
ncbi:putative O-methyltransferase [Aspergillus clavatus NRRL 1]|uniref:O-methyltransferase, putative n=1 Tax=Aspergillus clavatus (strain ATCC 1007 / CBS 513.65 / DSM 816 / NCTC 3887 / NRRL 1 / QM 1276 / 107) TaxID=344612 RepID=A1CPQ8_ASPCL|nr:O-methyltransferase, putative [Aspergillus clavatus NRRL 1]EAW07629.1 O-methyltransferase, putative [Aspergillus clavatus NRRL 1]